MSLTVVVGGQYGSEGKGTLVSYLASTISEPLSVVRTGGSNAGHTAHGGGKTFRLRQLPSGAVSERCELYLAAGMLIDLPVLLHEIDLTGVCPWRLHIDHSAALISKAVSAFEAESRLRDRIGSTLSGTGAATARKILRQSDVVLASDVAELQPYLTDVSDCLNRALETNEHVIVEGTQGFGLSLHHSASYPYVTSRDTTASAFLSDAGLSPLLVSDVIMVIRRYPIRVAGASGPLFEELTWDQIAERAGYPRPPVEYTTVTRKVRRVGEFDWDLVRRAVQMNRPTALALHGTDHIDFRNYGKTSWENLGIGTREFVERLEETFGVPVSYVFTGPEEGQIVDRRLTYDTRRRDRMVVVKPMVT